MVPKIISEAESYFATHWPDSGEADLRETFSGLIILTASATLMGPEIRANLVQEVARIYHALDNGLTPFSVFFPRAPTKAHKARDAARKEMVDIFAKVIQVRRGAGEVGVVEMVDTFGKSLRARRSGWSDRMRHRPLSPRPHPPRHVTESPATPPSPSTEAHSPSPLPLQSRREASSRGERHDDFLQVMVDFRYKDTVDRATGKVVKQGVGYTDDEITGLLIVLLFAGQHTSSITTAWLGAMILSHPKELAKLQEEQAAVFGPGDKLNYEALLKMDGMRRAISETLRLYPPLILLIRKVMVEREVGQFTIPKGDIVMMCMPAGNKDPRYWSQPEEFKPERFAPGSPEADTWSSKTVRLSAPGRWSDSPPPVTRPSLVLYPVHPPVSTSLPVFNLRRAHKSLSPSSDPARLVSLSLAAAFRLLIPPPSPPLLRWSTALTPARCFPLVAVTTCAPDVDSDSFR
jgi:cytochrome P450